MESDGIEPGPRDIAALAHQLYGRFWTRVESKVNAAILGSELTTPFG